MKIDRVRNALSGISGVHITPYNAAGGIDEHLLTLVITRIVNAGVHNVVTGGNTGEFYALTADELTRLHSVAIEAVNAQGLVTAAVGRSLPEALAMGRAAIKSGADAIMIHHPLDPFAAASAQVEYFVALADELTVPVVPYLRSDLIGLPELMRLAMHPNVAGIKFANPNLMLLSECIRATKKCPVIWTCGLGERWAAPFYVFGARGFTSGLANVYPELSVAVWKALERGDYLDVRRLVDTIAPFEAMRTRYNNGANVTVVKCALQLIGLSVGSVRSPGLSDLEPMEREDLRRILAAWGLLEQ
jgi:4-hydroxy-tetrahydrodipicolinate synthase